MVLGEEIVYFLGKILMSYNGCMILFLYIDEIFFLWELSTRLLDAMRISCGPHRRGYYIHVDYTQAPI